MYNLDKGRKVGRMSSIEMGIPDLAHQHDHRLYGKSKTK